MDVVNHIQLTVSPAQVKPVLRALLYAIFFHRLLDGVEPETYEIAETHVAAAPTPSIEKEVTAKVDEFAHHYLERGSPRGEIAVVFLHKKPKKGWFAVVEELVPWEEHLITLSFPRAASLAGASSLEATPPPNPLPEALLHLLEWCAAHTAHIPPLPSSDSSSSSYRIMVAPPPPAEVFSPSPPVPARSPPPQPTTLTTNVMALAPPHDRPLPPGTSRDALPVAPAQGGEGYGYGYSRRDSSPASLPGAAVQAIGSAAGYLGSVKDGVRAVAGWGGRGGGAGKSGQ